MTYTRSRALAAAAVLATAAGVGAVAAPAADAAPTSAVTVAKLKPAQLKAALLTQKDMPKGFKAAGSAAGTPGGGSLEGVTPLDACSKKWLDAETKARGVSGVAAATFVRSGGASTIVNGVSEFASLARAKGFLAAERTLAKQCPTVSWKVGENVTLTMKYSALSMARQGEESLALSLVTTVKQSGQTVQAKGSTVLLRPGDVVSSITTTVFEGSVPAPAKLAAASSARVAKVLR